MTNQTTPMKQEEWEIKLEESDLAWQDPNEGNFHINVNATWEELLAFISQLLLQKEQEVREEERGRIKDLIYHSMIRKNERNELMYAVEIDNYNMALDDLLKAIEIV